MNRFYRIKEVCIDLGIGVTSLRQKIANGELPPLEYPFPINSRKAGYSHDTYQKIINKLNVSNVANDMNNK
jgi:hypothetical protein